VIWPSEVRYIGRYAWVWRYNEIALFGRVKAKDLLGSIRRLGRDDVLRPAIGVILSHFSSTNRL
jgi:hypothetical protein